MNRRNHKHLAGRCKAANLFHKPCNTLANDIGRGAVDRFAVISAKHNNRKVNRIMGFQQSRQYLDTAPAVTKRIIEHGCSATQALLHNMKFVLTKFFAQDACPANAPWETLACFRNQSPCIGITEA